MNESILILLSEAELKKQISFPDTLTLIVISSVL